MNNILNVYREFDYTNFDIVLVVKIYTLVYVCAQTL